MCEQYRSVGLQDQATNAVFLKGGGVYKKKKPKLISTLHVVV